MIDFCFASSRYVGSLVLSMALGCSGVGCIVTSLGLAFVLGFGFIGLSSKLPLHLCEYLNVFNVISALQSLHFTFLCFILSVLFLNCGSLAISSLVTSFLIGSSVTGSIGSGSGASLLSLFASASLLTLGSSIIYVILYYFYFDNNRNNIDTF